MAKKEVISSLEFYVLPKEFRQAVFGICCHMTKHLIIM